MKTTLRLYALANEMQLAGTAPQDEILIPYGTWPYGIREVAGRKVFVVQRLTPQGAARIAARLTAAMANGAPGLPIYWGHPDVPDMGASFPDKRAKAWVKGAEATPAGLRLHNLQWLEDPAGGFGWYSPYWFGTPHLTDAHNATVEVTDLSSIGLTNTPNIHEFRLANEANHEPHTTTGGTAAQPEEPTVNREQILQALGLPAEATDEQVIAEITKLKAAAADAATKVEAANDETAAEKEEKEELKEALANERRARTDLLLDQAIADGRISPAARPAWAKRLTADPSAGALALANERPLKTAGITGRLGRAAGATADSPVALANEKVARQGIAFDAAWIAVKRERPDLFQ